MRTKTVCQATLITLLLTFGCKQNSRNNDAMYDDDAYYEALEEAYGEDDPESPDQYTTEQVNHALKREKKGLFSKVFNGGKKKHEFRDARTGLVVNSTEYPGNWQVISKPTYTIDQKIPLFLMQIQGPDNLKTFNTPIKFNLHYPNYQTAQLMRQYSSTASMIRPIISNAQIMEEEVNSRMTQSGFQLVGQKHIPRAKRYLRNMLNKSGGQQAQLDHYVTEWTNNKGQKALVTLIKIAMTQPLLSNDSMVFWFYSLDYVFVDDHKLDETINKLLDATEATKDNPQWKQYMAQLSQQRAREAARKHQRNMQNRQVAFNAHQQKMKGIWAAQDANHASFMGRTFGQGSDVGQKRFINMINEQETVYNPSTGRNYQVQAGSNEYWMDSDGNYVKNDNYFYNPNGDINLNNRSWTKVKKAF